MEKKIFEIDGIEYEFSMQKHIEGVEVLTVLWDTPMGESVAMWTADEFRLPEDEKEAAEWLGEDGLDWSSQSDEIMWSGEPMYLKEVEHEISA